MTPTSGASRSMRATVAIIAPSDLRQRGSSLEGRRHALVAATTWSAPLAWIQVAASGRLVELSTDQFVTGVPVRAEFKSGGQLDVAADGRGLEGRAREAEHGRALSSWTVSARATRPIRVAVSWSIGLTSGFGRSTSSMRSAMTSRSHGRVTGGATAAHRAWVGRYTLTERWFAPPSNLRRLLCLRFAGSGRDEDLVVFGGRRTRDVGQACPADHSSTSSIEASADRSASTCVSPGALLQADGHHRAGREHGCRSAASDLTDELRARASLPGGWRRACPCEFC